MGSLQPSSKQWRCIARVSFRRGAGIVCTGFWQPQGDHPMLRTLACAVFAMVLVAGGLLADEVKGKVKSVDLDKKTITVTVGDKDQDYSFSDDTKLSTAKGPAP